MIWTEERDGELKRLRDEKLSASAIAERMELTHGAVCGRLHRLGLGPISQRPGRPLKPRAAPKRSLAKKATNYSITHNPVVKDAPGITDLPPDESPCAVLFFEHRGGMCKWPLNDTKPIGKHLWCGAPILTGCPYCERHFRVSRNQRAA